MDRSHLPIPDPPFTGTIGETYKDSEPAWPAPVVPPDGAPNVVVIMPDDVGFGQTSAFGGPVPTPHLEKFGVSQAGIVTIANKLAGAGIKVVSTTPTGFWVMAGAGCIVGAVRNW